MRPYPFFPSVCFSVALLAFVPTAHATDGAAMQQALARAQHFIAGEFSGSVDMRLDDAITIPPPARRTASGETPHALDGQVYGLESDPLVAVSGYEVGTPLRDHDSVIVPVDFTIVAGTQGEGVLGRHFVRPPSPHEQIRLRMVRRNGVWKVQHPPLPHVKAAVLHDALSQQLAYANIHLLTSPNTSQAQRATYAAMQAQLSELEAIMTPLWPKVGTVSMRIHVTSDQPHVNVVIPDASGKPLYRLSCHEGDYESAEEGAFDPMYQCKLWDLSGAIRGDLFSPTPQWSRSRTRARFYAEQANGACADHAYYGKDRRYRFMGMGIRLRIDDLKQPDMRAMLTGKTPSSFAFNLTFQVRPDSAATTEFMGPAPEQCSSYFKIDAAGKLTEIVTIGEDEAATD